MLRTDIFKELNYIFISNTTRILFSVRTFLLKQKITLTIKKIERRLT